MTEESKILAVPAGETSLLLQPNQKKEGRSYRVSFSIDESDCEVGDKSQTEAENEEEFFKSEEDKCRIKLIKAVSFTFLLVVSLSYGLTFLQPPVAEKSKKHKHKKNHHDHTIPTLLSIRDHSDGKYVSAASNELYEMMKISDFVLDRSQRANPLGVEMLQRGTPDAAVVESAAPSLSLSIDPAEGVAFHDQLQLTWSAGSGSESIELGKHDVIAMYCPASESNPRQFRDAATLKQAQKTTQSVLGHKAEDKNTWLIEAFPIVREETCEFRMYTRQKIVAEADSADDENTDDEPLVTHQYTLVASSGEFTVRDAMHKPTSLHLAYAKDASEMVAHFNTGAAGTPVVKYGTSKKHLTMTALGSSTTYTADDMCQAPANLIEPGKFTNPGQLHSVTMRDLEPDTEYHYMVGVKTDDKKHVLWSDVQQFRTAPVVGSADEPFTYVVYADQGGPGYGMSQGADRVTRRMLTEMEENDIRSVHHFGDLSYSNGAAHMWDTWSEMVSRFSARIPLMIGVGNHEYDHTDGGGVGRDPSGVTTPHGFQPEWGNFGTDSRGECGVPVSARFEMPQSEGSNGVYWYSYDYGTVHTVMISSEHDLSPGSDQYAWLENDLKSVDRSVTPWVVVESHRPLYNSADVPDNNRVGIAMREQIEDLLYDTGVDLFLSGHYHAYLRTCNGLYKSQCDNGGPTHITVGSAGAELDTVGLYDQEWTSFYSREWGYGRITVVNETALHWEFVADENGLVRDETWIIKDS